MAVITRDDFNEVDRRIAMKKQQEFNKFVKQLPIFANLSAKILKRLKDRCERFDCIKNQVIYREGDEATHIYIVMEGEFMISKQKPD